MFTPDPLELVETEEEKKTEEEKSVAETSAEFEYVLGRRQIASVSLVLLTGLAAFTAMAYMVGKSSAAVKTVTVQAPVPKPVLQTPVPVVSPPVAEAPSGDSAMMDAPLSGTPEKGRLYIQLASVERGFATLMAHGARKLGFPAFVATGASPSVYRVLSGPFPDKESYEKAKSTFQAAGLDTFTRKYSGEEESKTVMPKPDESVQP
jgi:cell division septation protein DedD